MTGTCPYAIRWNAEAERLVALMLPDDELSCRDVVEAFAAMLAADPEACRARSRSLSNEGLWAYGHPEPAVEITYRLVDDARVVQVIHVARELVPGRRPVFISYSHQDIRWLRELRKFLYTLEEGGLLRVWVDTDLRPGERWPDQIRRALASARVAVFLVSQDFLISPFIRNEELPTLLEKAKAGRCTILWMAVKVSQVDRSALYAFQALNDPNRPLDELPPARRNRIYKAVSQTILDALQKTP